MLRQRQDGSRTRSQLMREELGESVDHAVRAAGHAASGVRSARAQMAPVAGKFRETATQRWGATMAAFNDVSGPGAKHATRAKKRAMQARREAEKAIRARRGKRSRAPRLAAMLAVGAALGAAWALAQRRRRQQWEEFEPSRPMEPAEAARTVEEMAGAKTEDVVQTAAGGTEPTETSRARSGQRPTPGTETPEDLVSRASGEQGRL